MLAYPPFRQLILFNLILMIVIGSLGVFTIEYLRAESHLEASTVMYLSAFSFLGSLVMLRKMTLPRERHRILRSLS